MLKKLHLGVLVVLLLCASIISAPLYANSDIRVTIDEQLINFDAAPTIIKGRTMVPFRKIFEGLGADVLWDSTDQSIIGTRNDLKIILQIDNHEAVVNEKTITLDVPPTIIDNSTMVPVRFIAEALGAEVSWSENNRTVAIDSKIPYNLTKYYILESEVRQLAASFERQFYYDLETAIRRQFNPDNYSLLEAYLRRTYPEQKGKNGKYIGLSSQDQVQGIYEWNSGSKYIGDWVNGSMEGKGIYYWPDGGYYIGEWKNSHRNGWGILATSDGDVYIGEWLNDNMEGHGIYYWEDGEVYRGQWSLDQRQGLGAYSWLDGNTYIGQLHDGTMGGLGTFIWYDKEQYLGQYSDGLKNGSGIYYWRPDFVFRGEYTADQRSWGTFESPGKHLLNLREHARAVIRSIITPEMDDEDKLKALHDYVVLLTDYDRENFDSNAIPPEAHTAYGVFVNKKAVCDGYAEALHCLLQAAGLESMVITGEAKYQGRWVGHAWLIVKINDRYAHVDVTWADPDENDLIYYDYFLVSDIKIAADHRWDNSLYPACP